MGVQLNVVIVGAGIAGLSTAIALRRKGHTVTVLERHPGCQALGGPVGLSANATRVLIEYDMKEIMEKKDARGQNAIYQRRYTGEILGSRTNDQTVKNYGFPGWTLARFRLQETLLEVAEERGADIKFNSEVVSIDMQKPSVELKDGSVLEADLVVGADGIRSIVRDALAGGSQVQTSSPLSGYNIDVPRSFLHADPTLSSLLLETNFWLGPAKIVCGLNMPDHGDMYNLCLISEEEEGKEGQWYTLGDLEKVKKKYESFDKRILKILDKAKPEDCHVWRLAETPPLERWCSEEGKVVIVGDAPHAMLPYTGMGAAQCIEDSACLSLCLERAESTADLSKVLNAYETIRKPRTEWLAKKGRENAVMWHYPDGALQQKRDEFLSRGPLGINKAWDGKPIDDPPEGPFNPLTFPYMQGYDITDYTRRRLDQILV